MQGLRSDWREIIRPAVALSYLAIHLIVGGSSSGISAWDIAPALGLIFLVWIGPRWMPVTLAAAASSSLLQGVYWPVALAGGALEAGASTLAASILRRSVGKTFNIASLRSLAFLLAAAVIGATGVFAERLLEVLATGTLAAPALTTASKHFMGTLAAILCLGPLVAVPGLLRFGSWRGQSLETALQVAALSLICWEVFVRSANSDVHYFYLLFLPVAWITIRHGQLGAALTLAVVYVVAVASDRMLQQAFMPPTEQQIRLGALAVTALLLGVMVSERRLSQEQLVIQQNELAHFQRLNVGSEMASALAHELNQPLSAAMNYCHAALRLMRSSSPDIHRTAEALAKGIDQIERAGQTIHGLRNFMRKRELRLAPARVHDLVEQAFRLVSAEAGAANVSLVAGDLAALPLVRADQIQIVQVLVNVLRNAVQAIAEAGMEKGAVSVTGEAAEGNVALGVTDTGPGLAPEIAQRLFEPFATSKPSGMGLGLAISKTIINAHGGEMRVGQVFHGGATFVIVLPIAREGASDA